LSQLHLLAERRFWPLFWTQFLGAFNDNLFKNALVILIAYRSMTLLGIGSATIVVACAGIFIFPFFLFSATAGQLADHYPKWVLMRWVKVWEIGVMVLAGVGFAINNLALLLTVLFLMGMQSTFFGPAKYAILPELLDDETLVGGNALVAMATFLAILLGTITGGLVIAGGDRWVSRLGLMVVAVAALGFVTSIFIKKMPAANPDLAVRLNPVGSSAPRSCPCCPTSPRMSSVGERLSLPSASRPSASASAPARCFANGCHATIWRSGWCPSARSASASSPSIWRSRVGGSCRPPTAPCSPSRSTFASPSACTCSSTFS
jgi:MFS family permease